MEKSILLFPYTYDAKIVYEYSKDETNDLELSLSFFKEQERVISEKSYRKGDIYDKEAVVLCDNIHQFKLEPYIKKITQCINARKPIYITPMMKKVLLREFPEQEELLKKVRILEEKYSIDGKIVKKSRVNIPVITCIGLNENSDKFRMELELYRTIAAQGYKCSVITSNSLGLVLGFHSIPEFLFDDKLNLENKIVFFNQFLNAVVNAEKPDVLIIGVPGAILPMNQYISNHFAEAALAIGNAVETDAAVMNLNYVQEINRDFVEELGMLAKYKLNMPVEAIAISNQRVSFNSEDRALDILYLENDFVNAEPLELKDKISKPVFYIADIENCKKGIEKLIENLSGNVETI